jgi:NAD(P)-dependent dehydrogenase (short-subunit alcohol dehydrogenase family)
MSDATFTGRSVLVTRATRGIGQAITAGFGRRAGNVLVGGRDWERGENVAGQIRSHGGRADFIPADLHNAAPGPGSGPAGDRGGGSGRHRGQQRPDRRARPDGAAGEADLDAVDGVEEANGVLDDAST